jgi:hypothetical protein
MRMRALGVLIAFICAATMTPLTAQDSGSAPPKRDPRPPYTPQAMLRRIQGDTGAKVSQNAALRYWMAFAQMKELPVGSSTTDADALLDANADALATLARATRLSECDWGLDYDLGPSAPIAHLPKARALARVNSAAAVRSMSRGKTDEAVDRWLVGMRFAQHVESGGTLISTLSAWSVLREAWDGMQPWIAEKRLTPFQRGRLADAVRGLPETVFRWDLAVLNEARLLETASAMGQGSFARPTFNETMRFQTEVHNVTALLTLSPDQTAPAVATFDKDTKNKLHPFYRDNMPSLTRVNDTRREVKAAREKLLAALK